MMWWESHAFMKIRAGYISVNTRNEDLKQSGKEVKIKQERVPQGPLRRSEHVPIRDSLSHSLRGKGPMPVYGGLI